MSAPHGTTDREIARALSRAGRGVALDVDEATALLHARGEALETLLDLASAVHAGDQGHLPAPLRRGGLQPLLQGLAPTPRGRAPAHRGSGAGIPAGCGR